METPRALLDRALAPEAGFRTRAAAAPALSASFWEMAAWRTPLAFLELLGLYASLATLYGQLQGARGPIWEALAARLGNPEDLAEAQALLTSLPAPPGPALVLPGLVLAALLYAPSLWLHDATFDHLALWLLRGAGRGFRTTLVAEAEALKVGAVGAAIGLLSALPGAGCALSLLLAPVAVWFWILRGFALAAWHGCPLWKGVAATLLHGVLVLALILLTALAALLLVLAALA